MPEDHEVTVQIIGGVAGIERYPELLELVGGYLVRYEPENARKGEQWIWTSDDRAEALRLPFSEFHELLGRSVGTRPWDGKPDRPISAFHITIARTDLSDPLEGKTDWPRFAQDLLDGKAEEHLPPYLQADELATGLGEIDGGEER